MCLKVGLTTRYPSPNTTSTPASAKKDESPAETALRVLRGNDVQSSKPSAHISMGVTNPILGSGPQKTAWWWSPERPYTKRRQNMAYYNLNSFGLRYGKREQNMLAEFKQIPVNSQRYTTLHYRCKDTDYINISEGTLNLNNKKSCNIDYENVTEAQKKITEKDHKNCDDGNASDSSDTSVESTVHYSKVVFPKADK
ncbi:hypothetical protein E1301_Tti010503 [Triplophysa tibetana]|uniref:Uncharacterized protein n=1 Tax=Triplophysa tibetana TaxID=1572043 RepID=A0A5A9NED9_9TELE|nr:hypothetical protein E1301_Tti010503 [Triplophysa tibetana]